MMPKRLPYAFLSLMRMGSFDAASRLVQRSECPQACLLPGSTPITTTLSYDPAGNVRALARYDSMAGGAQAERTL